MNAVTRFEDDSPATLPLLYEGLRALSDDLGDPFELSRDCFERALFGPHPSCRGMLALGPDGTLWGMALYSPVLSSVAGGAGAYVSDLWVAEAARGQRLGPRLLAEAGRRAGILWGAEFIKLVSYRTNTRALAFYTRLGFEQCPEELPLRISLGALLKQEE